MGHNVHTHTHTHTHRGEPVRVVVVVPFSPCRAKERQRAACTRVTITISLLSRGPCIYRPIQRKYGEYDHKVLGPLGSGEIACTICSCAYHKRGGSSYVIAVSRLSLFLSSSSARFLREFAAVPVNKHSLRLPPCVCFRETTVARIVHQFLLIFFLFPSRFSPFFTLDSLLFFLVVFFALYQRSTRLLGIPGGVPTHATGSPATLDFVLWNPNTLVWSGVLDVHQSATGNPWTAAAASRWNRVCKTLFLDEFNEERFSRKLRPETGVGANRRRFALYDVEPKGDRILRLENRTRAKSRRDPLQSWTRATSTNQNS